MKMYNYGGKAADFAGPFEAAQPYFVGELSEKIDFPKKVLIGKIFFTPCRVIFIVIP